MIEQGLVYIYSPGPPRVFRGCGALVEGGYVATCRHVWLFATGAAKADPNELACVEVEYPWSRKDDGTTVRHPARLVEACEAGANPPPDLVLLRPDEIPNAGVTLLRPACEDRFQVGKGYAIAGLVRDKNNPNAPQDAEIEGTIARHKRADGRHEFKSSHTSEFWFDRGSSGSPVFLDTGEQLAGIVSLSELGANEGKSPLHEAFVVPGTTIRAHLVRLTAAATARGQHIDVADLQPVLDKLGAQDIPLAEIPGRITQFIEAARARGAEKAPASNEGADIDAVIGAARQKLSGLDTAAARSLLAARPVGV
jgi:hypothetical protein